MALIIAGWVSDVHAALWVDATAATLGPTGQWSNKVTLADINGDGLLDVLVANGGDYSSAGEPQQNRVFLNQGPGLPFQDGSLGVFGDGGDLARSIKVADFNGDGVMDLITATTYQTRSRLHLGLGVGLFLEVTDTHTPAEPRSFGDVEAGDMDGDGDLDLVFADWGPGAPQNNAGAPPRLWLNNGEGSFTDVTASRMPFSPVRWSWDLELVDVDNDFDLDVVVSCKSCERQCLFENDGAGYFDIAHDRLAQSTNNYEFAPMDFNGDGWLDLATVNDGPGLDEGLLINDGTGRFNRAGEDVFPDTANVGEDDNVIEWNDIDSDGDADMLVGSLSGKDRVLWNQDGLLSLQADDVLEGDPSPGTLGIAMADLDGDGRADVVMAQGELDSPERLFLGDQILPDTAPPWVGPLSVDISPGEAFQVQVRVHDRQSPTGPHDLLEVALVWRQDGGEERSVAMTWFGEYLWRASALPLFDGDLEVNVCAKDRAGNRQCSQPQLLVVEGFGPKPPPDRGPEPEPEPTPELGQTDSEASPESEDASPERVTSPTAQEGCVSGAPPSAWFGLVLVLVMAWLLNPSRRRWRARRG